MRFRGRYLALALPLALGLLAGCGEEQDPISYVQPNVLEKTFFVGKDLVDPADDPEFWAQQAIVDVGYGASQDGLFTSTWAQPMSRVKWVIQEDHLIARLSYERIEGADGKGAGKLKNDGVVVAMFAIDKHFDIQRRYNPATGEPSNVIEENTSDRPWYERDYMRVDWSKNLATDTYDFDTLALVGIYGGVDYEPVSYYVNDPTDEDAPFFDGKTGYFDVTTKAFAVPKTIDLSYLGWGIDSFPACFLDADFAGGTAPAGTCNPVELTLRHSFRPVVDNDYEPQNWDGHRFKAFGAFTVERYGFARNYGMTDDLHRYFISRYNLWQRSHYYDDAEKMTGPVECYKPAEFGGEWQPGLDPNRGENGDGTADECAAVTEKLGVGGSQCDSFNQKCTLPYRAREVRPVTWYYATGSDPRYFEGTEFASNEWDIALRSAVQAAKYAECMLIGDEPEVQDAVATKAEVCRQKYPVWEGQMDDALDAIYLSREVDACRHRKGENCEALADTVAAARGIDDAEVIKTAKMGEVVVLCHSPVEHGDPEVCGYPRLRPDLTSAACFQAREDGNRELLTECNEALNARRGDLRFHVINAIPTPQTPSPWGIMADAADPLTGEKVSASINVWTYINDLWAQQVVDTARYIRGELATEDITEGTYIKDWSKAAEAASRSGALAPMTQDELDKKFAAAVGIDSEQFKEIRARFANLDADVKANLKKIAKETTGVKAQLGAPSAKRSIYEARRQRAVGTQTEAALVTPMMQQLAGVDGISDTRMATEFASPLRGTNPVMARELRQMKEAALAACGACVLEEAPAPLSIANLATQLEAKFGAFNKNDSKADQLRRAEKMRAYIAQRAQYNVIAHEMGHSVGHRHNFISSSDAWGFRPQYWQLRTNNGTLRNECVDPVNDQPGLQPDGNCVGPRWFDPMTDNERDNLVWMWMQSSIMDYAGETSQDFLGIGAYDFAAARMFYGETMPVFANSTYKKDTVHGAAMIEKQDNFGGIVGLRWTLGDDTLHYSQLQDNFNLISGCAEVNADAFKPTNWDEDRDGKFSPLLDALIVEVNGKTTRCKQQPVDYVPYRAMKSNGRDQFGDVVGKQFDATGRVRVPYGFATDGWADLGNLSVYRHDNGADAYELFDFFITQQETGHIFDNYRRNRAGFSVRGAYSRALSRFNEKMRDGAKGLGLMANVYRSVAEASRLDYESLWSFISTEFYPDNILASTIAFDQFTRMMQRPEAGPHFLPRWGVSRFDPGTPYEDGVWRSNSDSYADNTPDGVTDADLVIPNGATGLWGVVNWGGRPIENALSNSEGEYNSRYTVNAGSYYEKAYTAILMTESVDNFISDSRGDFVDPRYRAVSLADLFPDGYRRWFANNLTGDDQLKGPRIAARVSGGELVPEVDGEKYPEMGMGWTSWTPKAGPEACFVAADRLEPWPDQAGRLHCTAAPDDTIVLDPQVGWEQQKFLIAWTLQYLPENQQQNWLNMMYVWELGADSDPGFENRIELHDPFGRIYVAKTFGKETIFGKRVQKGISARMLEYGNELIAKAFVTDPGPDLDGDMVPDWYIPQFRADREPRVKYDPSFRTIDEGGAYAPAPGCNADTNEGCTCELNAACITLKRYMEVPFFMRQAMSDYGLAHPSMRGVY